MNQQIIDNKNKIESNKDLIIKSYVNEGKSVADTARLIDINQAALWRYFKKQGIEVRKCYWNQYYIDENYFQNIDSHEKAYFLGWLWSDGFIISRLNRVGMRIHPKDIKVLENFKKCLKTKMPIRVYKSIRKENKKRRFRGGITEIAQFTFSNEKILNDLKRVGITDRKSLTIDFPNIDRKYFYSFMRGYFEGDGCFYIDKKEDKKHLRFIVIFLASRKFTEKAVKILKEDGFGFSVRKSTSCPKIYHVAMGNKDNVVKFLDKLYENDDKWLRLDRKYNIYLKMKQNLLEYPVDPKRVTSKTQTVKY